VDAAYKLAVASEWVYSDITLIADRIASQKWEVKKRSGEDLKEIQNHPFERLWGNPGGLYSSGLLSRYLVWWYLLRGNSYLFVATDAPGRGEPRELWPLLARNVQPLPDSMRSSIVTGKPIIDYKYTVQGKPQTLPGENVIHFRTPNPFDWWEGLSPLNPAYVALDQDAGARRWQRDFYKEDNAIPAAIASLPVDMSQGDFESLVADIKQMITEGQRILFGRVGELSIDVIQQTIADMRLLETREFNRDAIDRVYKMYGYWDAGQSGDAQQAREMAFARNVVQPLLTYMADELTLKVAPYYGEDIVICAPDVVPQDRALELQEYQAYRLEMTINENRETRDMKPIKEFPVTIGEMSILDVPSRPLWSSRGRPC